MSNKLKHLAIIADGNGRWATQRGLSRSKGHEQGLYKIEDLMHWCVNLDIPVLSVYVFSLDNWKRDKEEIDNIFKLADYYFSRYQEFKENNIKVLISGVKDGLNEETLGKMKVVQEETKECDGLILNLCLNYSGRREIIDAIQKGARTEEEVTMALYNQLPMPDLILRTGGYQRLSDFLIWQCAYAELAFTHTLFPDLSLVELKLIKARFEEEERKFGGVIIDKRLV